MNGQPTEWFSIEITADSSAVEALEFLFNELGSLGTEVQQFHKKESDPFTVIGYFEKLPDEEWFDARLSDSLQVYGLPSKAIKLIERKTIEKTDWLAEWKKHWRPVQIGRFLIAPEWEELSNVDPNLIVIRIEPNMAFGTGTHETTQLCLKAIDEYFDAGMSFLDVGTGTGILAIAGVKKSDDIRSRVLAIDIDPDPIDIASKNAKRNSVYEKIEFRCDELTDDTPSFDFVCANLTLDAILPFLPRLLAKSKRILVLSGILAEQRKQLTAELNRFSIVNADIRQDGEWIAAVIRR